MARDDDLRFDDSLDTVLSAEMTSPFGAQSTWRQLVDLIGRRRVAVSDTAIARLRMIRRDVPPPVRGASARALATATAPAALVGLFAEDDLSIAAPVLRTAQLTVEEWTSLLPALTPAARSLLRHRRDLHPDVRRALESFGSVDFVLAAPFMAEHDAAEPLVVVRAEREAPLAADPAPLAPVAHIARLIGPAPADAASPAAPQAGAFEIADLVARIDAFQRERVKTSDAPRAELRAESFADDRYPASSFRFETDARGIVRWVDGAARAPLIGLLLPPSALPTGTVDRHAGFADARLVVHGQSDAAGEWRITGTAVFDPPTGRFTGYRGTARRPHVEDTAGTASAPRNPAADALRQLVHELRTPTNAIAGFAEMIEQQMIGPVPAPYRSHAAAILTQTSGLLNAIDDIDMAARIETQALDLRADDVRVAPLFDRVFADLLPLATLRGTVLDFYIDDATLAILGDDRAVDRLIARLMATLVAAGSAGERIGVAATRAESAVSIVFDRPAALAPYAEERLLTIDAEAGSEREGAPLLGTGFALRLARNLAAELFGSLTIGETVLTLRLPAAFSAVMERASTN